MAKTIYMHSDKLSLSVKIAWPADLTASDCDIIAHQTNCKGVMGAGAAKIIRNRFPEIFRPYRELCETAAANGGSQDLLGHCQMVETEDATSKTKFVANLFGQDGYSRKVPCTRPDAVSEAVTSFRVQTDALATEQSPYMRVGMPINMGCSLGGGKWSEMLPVIVNAFVQNGPTGHILGFYGNADTPDAANEMYVILKHMGFARIPN